MRVIALSFTFFILITLSLLYIRQLHIKLRALSKRLLKIKKEYSIMTGSNRILQKKVCRLRNRLIKEKRGEVHLKDRVAGRIKSGLMIVENELEHYKRDGENSYLTRVSTELNILIQNCSSLLESRNIFSSSQSTSKSLKLNISQLITGILEQYREGARLKRIKLKTLIEDNIFIKEEPSIISTIISNLLSNALKFTSLAPGERKRAVEVGLKSSNSNVYLTILDNGPGFAAAPESNGLGLGLKITSAAVESIGGKLTIMSRPGRGTECTIIFSKADEGELYLQSKLPTLPNRYLTPIDLDQLTDFYPHKESLPNILVISLEEGIIRLITEHLHQDFNVSHALTSIMAIKKLRSSGNIALIILDIPLQNHNTTELLKIVAEESPQTLLVITKGREESLKFSPHLSKLTPIIYAGKPFSIEELHRKLKAFFQNSQNKTARSITTTLNKTSFDLDRFARIKKLTSREKDILRYIIEGKTLKETAGELAISIETVKKYRQKLFSKLEVKSAREIFPKYFR